MVIRMFAILDVKADAFNTPFFFPSKGQAVRAFSDLVNDGQSMVHKHPEDYKLVDCGEFNMANAEFVPSGVISLGFGSDFVIRPSLREVGNA